MRSKKEIMKSLEGQVTSFGRLKILTEVICDLRDIIAQKKED